jgi:malonyl CoA-acyl carrier protein transacylase
MVKKLAFVFSGQRLLPPGFLTNVTNQKRKFLEQIKSPSLKIKVNSIFSLYSQQEVSNATSNILSQTDNTQIAIFLRDLILYDQLISSPEFTSNFLGNSKNVYFGNSIGEITALAAAGFFSLEDAIKIIEKRGGLLHDFYSSSSTEWHFQEMGMALVKMRSSDSEESTKAFWGNLLKSFDCEISIHLSEKDKVISGPMQTLLEVAFINR